MSTRLLIQERPRPKKMVNQWSKPRLEQGVVQRLDQRAEYRLIIAAPVGF